MEALARDQTFILKTQLRLSGVFVKFGAAENKKLKFKQMKNPVMTNGPFYILPPKFLAALWEIFTREQIELFTRVQNLREVVQLGLDMHKWRSVEGIPAVPADYNDMANKVAFEVLETYPYVQNQGLPNMHDFVYAMLYRATPPTWLTDAPIQALCLRSADDFSSCRFAGFQTAWSGDSAAPLNFYNAHWCCVTVRLSARRIYYYDPPNQAPYLNASNAIATQLNISGLQEYELVQMNNPVQSGAYSCGVYVCWMFARLVVPRACTRLHMHGDA
ncbi:hypothetical protein PHMEG_0006638 [Phytophthora megakarya]|uniref:Ubiquitin-like protease family profile domain-containing protein n=1 Tax=Phytophthora megakarya TaxID=4795 RepID=A0A225WNE0_9STRA|nr:hypothetical protein PHMEG_0006638 [Phytophthora megakarya]